MSPKRLEGSKDPHRHNGSVRFNHRQTDAGTGGTLQDVTSDLYITNPQVNVEIDRDKASALGVTADQIENALYTAYGQRQISTIYAPNNAYRVITELQDQYQKDPSALSLLYVRSSKGQLVPLNAVARLTRTVGPLTINHLGQLPAVTLSFNLKQGVALEEAKKKGIETAELKWRPDWYFGEIARYATPDNAAQKFADGGKVQFLVVGSVWHSEAAAQVDHLGLDSQHVGGAKG